MDVKSIVKKSIPNGENHNSNEKKIAIQVVGTIKAHAMKMTNDVKWQWNKKRREISNIVASRCNSANEVKCVSRMHQHLFIMI